MSGGETRALDGHLETGVAGQEDIEGIKTVLQGVQQWLASRGSRQWSQPFADEWIRGFIDRGGFFVAKVGGDVVGVFRLIWSDVPYWGEMEDGQAGYIHTVAVSREWKGHQIGLKMIAWAEGRIAEFGRRFARLDCSDTFRHYYEAAGYRQVGVQMMGDWEAQLMEKEVGRS